MAINGFSLLREEEISEYQTVARLYRHDKTGARVLSLANDDENKVFGAAFRTPPRDSTGVAHILEHSVLNGSRKYPVKEPFVELLKGSLKTFLNAFTFPDKTCYPVSSCNLQDFRNLVDVYLDAAFHPLITRHIFMQEGWHHELDDPDGPLKRRGVVYNEMKGAYSSPDSLLHEYSQQAVFPDQTYGLDSGGNPKTIPELTFEQFREFHETFYHPANCWFLFHGDGPEEDERLSILAEYLDGFGPLEPESEVALQQRWSEPRRERKTYACSEDGEDERGYATLGWLLCETAEVEENLALRVLEEVLVGMPSSPLRQALIDSGLGEDLAGIGLEEELRQMYFSIGLKGIKADGLEDTAGRMQGLVTDTLRDLADNGVPEDVREAALNTIEFDLRETNTGSFPRGLALWLRSLTTWLYDGDPLAMLAFEEPLGRLKQRLADGEPVFENLIRRWFLENPHACLLTLAPDPELGSRREREEKEELARELEGMDQAERERIMAETRELREKQEKPDDPADLARIPALGREDMPPENREIPFAESEERGALVMRHEQPAAGIVYFDAGFDLSGMDEKHLPWLPLFGRALVEMGTKKRSFTELTRAIAAKTGGIDPAMMHSTDLEGTPVSWFFLRGKATSEKAQDMAELMTEVLTSADFSDAERFTRMALEEKARLEQRVTPAGHLFVQNRLRGSLTRAGRLAERTSGAEYLFFLRELCSRLPDEWPEIRRSLEAVRDHLLTRSARAANVTATAEDLAAFDPHLDGVLAGLPGFGPAEAVERPPMHGQDEALLIPAAVNYVGKAVNYAELGIDPGPAAMAVSRWLRMGYLWDRIRVQGGAYGAFCALDDVEGTLGMVSYRDPNSANTLAVYDGAADLLASLELDKAELDKAVVGAIGEIDAHHLPDAKGFISLTRRLTGRTPQWRQEKREAVLRLGNEDFRRFGEAARALAEHGRVVVMGPEQAAGEIEETGRKLERLRIL
ncbi:insulinase family protein [Desulfohalovibrio reitneri]|uniref:insulinase family protein n=1 Tax=Desulfohalovibrio reitneri TaxID=1307759 RepID=UPI0004A74234|nr:insulinase family protein [Desulfohalovibrio reitneri]